MSQTATTAPPAAALPVSLRNTPRLSSWLQFEPEGRIAVRSGKVEIGQGILAALAQIVAEELDVDYARIRMVGATTRISPDESVTSGSLSVQQSGTALRLVCAQARARYLNRAAELAGLPADALRIDDGQFYHDDTALGSYWSLDEPDLLDVDADADTQAKPSQAHHLVGRLVQRPDIHAKVFGQAFFIHDLELPGMVHGRIVRPPSPSATRQGEIDAAAIAAGPDVLAVACDGSLLGVVASQEASAERAARQLAKAAQWQEVESLPDVDALPAWLRQQPRITTTFDVRSADPALPPPARTYEAEYSKPFIKHASIGPSCALACWQDGALSVWTHSQGIYNLRTDLATAFDIDESLITVHHVPGAGCYGHNGADDVAFDAAWLASHHPGQPVRVQWSRADELSWSPMGPAMSVRVQADLDEAGNIQAWRHELWSPGHSMRPGRAPTPTLLGTWYRADPAEHIPAIDMPRPTGGGADRNADPLYDIPDIQLTCHRVTGVPIRTSSLRALGAFANVFAIESTMDDLADAAGVDPLDYRLRQLRDPRAIDVLTTAAEAAGWRNARGQEQDGVHGWGLAVARYKGTGAYCAVVAHIELAERIRVHTLTIAVDVGQVINPDGVRQQTEGGAIQATSWALMEAARFDRTRMTDGSWGDYAIIRFSEVPQVDVHIVSRPDAPPLGSGEASLGPTGAAIANAVFHAMGVRVRALPLTPERIVAAMEAGG